MKNDIRIENTLKMFGCMKNTVNNKPYACRREKKKRDGGEQRGKKKTIEMRKIIANIWNIHK